MLWEIYLLIFYHKDNQILDQIAYGNAILKAMQPPFFEVFKINLV